MIIRQFTTRIAALLIISIMACEGPTEPHDKAVEGESEPGRLQIVPLEGIAKSNITIVNTLDDNDTVGFNLGEIKASRDFYFILKNVGGSSITDITIESSNPSFLVSPRSIDILEPDSAAAIVPILRITTLHGVPVEGIGFVDLMPMGVNSSIILINGTTTVEADSIPVGVVVSVSLTALVMDISLISGGIEVDLADPQQVYYGTFDNILVSLPIYKLAEKDTFRIVNTGNVPITITEYQGYTYDNSKLAESTLDIGDTLVSVIASVFEDTPSRYFAQHLVKLSGDGTIPNHERLNVAVDGNSYLWLVYDSELLSSIQ